MIVKDRDSSAVSRKLPRATLGRVARICLGATPFMAVSLVWSSLSSLSSSAATIFKSNFEDGNYSEWRAGELHTPWALKIVPGFDGNNTKVARFEYRNTDVRKYDTVKADLAGPFVPMGTDQWYAFDFYLPSNLETAKRGPILFQNHANVKRTGAGFGGKPPTSFKVQKNNRGVDSYFFNVTYTKNGRITQNTVSVNTELGPAVKGTWQKALLRVKWSPDTNGRVEFYLNNQLRYSRSGIIGYKDSSGKYLGPYPRIGFYASGVKKSKNTTKYAPQSVIYFDNFQMGPTRASVDSGE